MPDPPSAGRMIPALLALAVLVPVCVCGAFLWVARGPSWRGSVGR